MSLSRFHHIVNFVHRVLPYQTSSDEEKHRLRSAAEEDDYDLLLSRIREEGLPEQAYGWYLDLRRYGTFVHSGFGLGLERTVAWICGITHIREAIAFPRMMTRLYP